MEENSYRCRGNLQVGSSFWHRNHFFGYAEFKMKFSKKEMSSKLYNYFVFGSVLCLSSGLSLNNMLILLHLFYLNKIIF